MNFLLDKNSKIVIYGAGTMGISWAEKAANIGLKVILFIDRSADDIKYIKKIPVVTFETYNTIADEDDIVIVMLQNAMYHSAIVKQLQKIGIRKVIFFPMYTLGMNKERVFCLRRKYNECIKLDFDDSLTIPILYDDKIYSKDEGIIWEGKKEIIVWAPAELCYSNHGYEKENIWKSNFTKESIKLWSNYVYDRSLFVLRPYWELFSFFDGKTTNCAMYLKLFEKERGNDQIHNNDKILKDRNSLINIFEEEFCKGNEFFEQSPANSGIGNHGKIVIYDGLHRSVFLLNRGYWWIPVCLSNSNYNYLFNMEAVQKLKDYLETNNISELEYPLETFGFYNYPIKHQYIRAIWKELIREITNRGWDINEMFDLSLTNAYFARMFHREGTQVVYCLIDDKSEIEMLVNDIFRINNMNFIFNTSSWYPIIDECEIIVICMEQFRRLFLHGSLAWKERLKCIVVYDVLVEGAVSIFDRVFGNNRKCSLIRRYVTDGLMRGMYIVE